MRTRERCIWLLALLLPAIPPAAAPASPAIVRWTCATPLLSDYRATGGDAEIGEGVSYVYAGSRNLHADYGADALFTLPLDGRHGWYDAGIHLAPLVESTSTVQIEISRWQRFDYRAHVAIAWSSARGTTVEYKDTGMMLDGRVPHRLGIYVRGDRLRLLVDNRVICSTAASPFVSPGERKYFQIRTETSVLGANTRATVSQIRLKRDSESQPSAVRGDCVMHRHGIFWQPARAGGFVARGAFYPGEATFFTGCRGKSY